MGPTASKTLGNHPRERRWSKDSSFLSFATKCRGRATDDLNVEAISFAIGQGCRSSQLIFSTLLDNSFVELLESNPKTWVKQELI